MPGFKFIVQTQGSCNWFPCSTDLRLHYKHIIVLRTTYEPPYEIPTMWYVRPAKTQISLCCAYAQTYQSLCWSLKYSMKIKLLTEYHLEFQSLKGCCTGSSESTPVKMSHCWKSSRVLLHNLFTCVRMFPNNLSQCPAKGARWHVHPSKTQVSQCIIVD